MSVRPLMGLLALALAGACNKQPAAAASQTTGSATTAPAKTAPPAPAQPGVTQPAAAGAAATPGQAPPAPEAPKPVPAVLPQVLARVDGQPIGRSELETAVKAAEANAGRAVPPAERDAIYRSLLDRVILFRLLAAEAKVRGIAVTPQEVSERMAQIKQQFPNEAEFQKKLAERHTTVAQLEEEQRRDLLHAKTIEAEIGPKATVAPQDIDAFYKQNPDQFKEPETIRASHILMPMTARAEAEGVLKRAKAGEDFAALAKQYSKDSGSAAVGGDLNYFPKEQMVPAFSAAAFALKPGEISSLVETQFGVHIIKLTDRRAGRTVPLAEVSERLGGFLKQRKQQELTQQYLLSLKAKYRVEVLL